MSTAKSIKTPMAPSLKLISDSTQACHDPSLYRSVIGSLQYLTITRPDIAYTVNKLCQFMHNPLEVHWKATKRLLRYLKGTLHHGLHYKASSDTEIIAYCDSDWASDQDDMRSTSGNCVYLGSNIVSWMAKKQRVVSRSSTEAEFRSLASLVTEIQYIQNLLSELHIKSKQPPLIWCDNQGVVLLSGNPVMHTKTKHFELDLWFVRERVARGQIQVKHIPGRFQVADLLTKSPSSTIFLDLRDKLT
uniref:Copia protein n=1 Tax=Cajanus cajan TaxID=3821 RepID=A0A151SR55_CAJCA|nr:Copia protein [Cajanus cajan]